MKNKFNLVIGLLLILSAVILLFSFSGFIPNEISQILISWQALICVLALVFLFTGHFLGAFALLVVGSYFLIPRIYDVYDIELHFTQNAMRSLFVGLILLILGLSAILGSCRSCRSAFFDANFSPLFKQDKNGLPHIASVFGETEHTVIEKPFKGAKISTAFGSTVFDMCKTKLSEGDSELLVNVAFGGVIIIVPYSWKVQQMVQVFFGGVSDRDKNFSKQSDKQLVIKGSLAFGGIEIRRAANETEEYMDYTEEEQIVETEGEFLDNITVKHNKNVRIITLDELNYIQADGDYVTLCTKQGSFLKEQTMKYFQNALPKDKFIRIHRSYIVNFSEIRSIDSRGKEIYYVILKDGTSLRSSSSGYQKLKKMLTI